MMSSPFTLYAKQFAQLVLEQFTIMVSKGLIIRYYPGLTSYILSETMKLYPTHPFVIEIQKDVNIMKIVLDMYDQQIKSGFEILNI